MPGSTHIKSIDFKKAIIFPEKVKGNELESHQEYKVSGFQPFESHTTYPGIALSLIPGYYVSGFQPSNNRV